MSILSILSRKEAVKDVALQNKLVLTPAIISIGACFAMLTGLFLSIGHTQGSWVSRTFLYVAIAMGLVLSFIALYKSSITPESVAPLVLISAMVACGIAFHEEKHNIKNVSWNHLLEKMQYKRGAVNSFFADLRKGFSTLIGHNFPILILMAAIIDQSLNQLLDEDDYARMAPYKTEYMSIMIVICGSTYLGTIISAAIYNQISQDYNGLKLTIGYFLGTIAFITFMYFVKMFFFTAKDKIFRNNFEASRSFAVSRETFTTLLLFSMLFAALVTFMISEDSNMEGFFVIDTMVKLAKILETCFGLLLLLAFLVDVSSFSFKIVLTIALCIIVVLLLNTATEWNTLSIAILLVMSLMVFMDYISKVRRNDLFINNLNTRTPAVQYLAFGVAGLYLLVKILEKYLDPRINKLLIKGLSVGVFYLLLGRDIESFFVIMGFMFAVELGFGQFDTKSAQMADYAALYGNVFVVFLLIRGILMRIIPKGASRLARSMAAFAFSSLVTLGVAQTTNKITNEIPEGVFFLPALPEKEFLDFMKEALGRS